MTKITPEHLERGAVVYVRQSTAFQVARNLESQRRQYGLSERARQLGWSDVEVIDDDLGRSGAGARRPGFEKLLAAICEGRVGAVLSLEASRLARNGRDWHTLLEFCGLVRTLIVDEDAIYDPDSPNDRLLLGMKGTMSEMELSVFRQRSIEAMKQKARRGELFLTVAVGYVKAGNDRIEKDADQPVQEAMALVFRKFAELQTIRQVLVWCRQEKVVLPALGNAQTTERIIWRLPVYSTVHHMLTNPVYAGAYAYGRRSARVTIENGRKRVVRSMQRDWRQWEVLIRDRHEGYMTWAEFERNQQLIADNSNGKGFASRGAVRSGEALLSASCVAPAAARSFACAMARPIVTSAWALSTSSPRRGASASAGCASTGHVPRTCWTGCSPWAWRRQWRRSRPVASSVPKRRDSSSWPCGKPITRPPGRGASTMAPIRRTAWWPANSNGAGTSV